MIRFEPPFEVTPLTELPVEQFGAALRDAQGQEVRRVICDLARSDADAVYRAIDTERQRIISVLDQLEAEIDPNPPYSPLPWRLQVMKILGYGIAAVAALGVVPAVGRHLSLAPPVGGAGEGVITLIFIACAVFAFGLLLATQAQFSSLWGERVCHGIVAIRVPEVRKPQFARLEEQGATLDCLLAPAGEELAWALPWEKAMRRPTAISFLAAASRHSLHLLCQEERRQEERMRAQAEQERRAAARLRLAQEERSTMDQRIQDLETSRRTLDG